MTEASVPVSSPPVPGQAGAPGKGGYQLGWELRPLTEDGNLDTLGGGPKPPHPPSEDMLYGMAQENKAIGNKRFSEGQFESAIAAYSELIMQVRSLENEVDVVWDDDSRKDVRMLQATAYLNLAACFLKTSQWTHANNTATRALIGDKDPPDPKHDVLPPDKKAKALFRRAQAQSEGFSNFETAVKDLEKAVGYAPEDKGIATELRRVKQQLAKSEKAASTKMAGFLSKKTENGEGLFGKDDNPEPAVDSGPKGPAEPVKIKDGLWMMPEQQKKKGVPVKEGEEDDPDVVDYDELSREINEMKEDDPEMFDKLRGQVKEMVEMQVAELESKEKKDASDVNGIPTVEEGEQPTNGRSEVVEPDPTDTEPGRPPSKGEDS